MSKQGDAALPWLMTNSDRSERLKEPTSFVTQGPHACILRLPLAIELVDHQFGVAADFETSIPGVDAVLVERFKDRLDPCDESPIFGLVIGTPPESQANQPGFSIGTLEDIRAVAGTGIAFASTIKDQRERLQGLNHIWDFQPS